MWFKRKITNYFRQLIVQAFKEIFVKTDYENIELFYSCQEDLDNIMKMICQGSFQFYEDGIIQKMYEVIEPELNQKIDIINKNLDSETLIDDIIDRINRKQLKK